MNPPILYEDGCHFSVWAPERKTMTLHLLDAGTGTKGETGTKAAMQKDDRGYFRLDAKGVGAGDRYFYMPEGERDYPDPCSASQPEGVHGPSQVVDHGVYSWHDGDWKGVALSSLIFYELHVGAFTPGGSFEAIIPRLDAIAEMGINAIELMPVAQFPGNRNWGYDGVFLYAVQHSYGGPEGLKKLVDACHRRGIAVFLDVVFNHIGPEGNHLSQYGPYFSQTYHTPWGKALNFDGAWSDGVREFVIGNVLYWADQYHIDGLRLDAVHEIFDRNAVTLWDELYASVRRWEQGSGRPFYMIAESDRNSPRTVQLPEYGGQGFDAQWLDDFHHALYVMLDPEGRRHYADFGELQQLAKAYTEGFVHSGEYVRFRKRRHGATSAGLPGQRFVVFNQNHDLPGNRPNGERLSMLVDSRRLRLAAAAVLLSPYLPLLFMGEEYGEPAPFFFFSDYSDPEITAHLREDRQTQFAGFGWESKAPDPQDEATFLQCKLRWSLRDEGECRSLLDWHRRLITLRAAHPLLTDRSKTRFRTDILGRSGLAVCRHSADRSHLLLCVFNFSGDTLDTVIPYSSDGCWEKLLDASSNDGDDTGYGTCELSADGSLRLPPWGMAVYENTISWPV